ncbi:MAG: amino acid ABC transporter substrate-binding protein [Desulfobacter sp.]|nr:MAG: amino acid ABC transporter substrate-binding protein [Desulfobacter sp.]
MIVLKKIIPFICVVLGVLSSSTALGKEKIVVSVDQGNPPFMYQENNAAAGIYPELIAAVFKRMGGRVAVKAYPWKRALKMCRDGLSGVGGIYKTRERLKIFDYSDLLYTENVLIYVRKDHPFRFNTLSDLKGKTIGVLQGWSYGDAFDRFRKEGNVMIRAGVNDHVTFKRLLNGNISCLFSIKLTGELIIRQTGIQDQVVALPKPVAVNGTYLVFAKKARRKALLEKFNAALAEMKADGSYGQVIQAAIPTGH